LKPLAHLQAVLRLFANLQNLSLVITKRTA
jgi:hypothetical protein